MKINNKNLFALIVTTIFALCSTSALSKQPPIDPSTIYVLAIGSCPPWQKIKAVCKNDVDLFASTLETNMGIPRGNIKKLIDSDATYKGVVKGFKWLTETVSENDSVIVYYNGHGMLLDLDGSQKEEVFVLWSKHYPFAGLYAVMSKLWMTDQQLASYLNQIPARNKLVIADTCHAAGTEEYLKYKGKKVDYGLEDTALIAAAEAGQLAFATGDYGLFTLRLADAMRTSTNMKEAFFEAREKTLQESRGICKELKSKKHSCKEQGPTIDDPLGIVKLYKLNTK